MHAHHRGEITVINASEAAECFIGMIRSDIHLRVLLGDKVPSKGQLRRHSATTVKRFLSMDHRIKTEVA
jgi:hypothetical protein